MPSSDKMDKIDEDIAWFAGEESGMIAAINQAQENFSAFKEELAKEARRIIPSMEVCLIKYAFPANISGVKVEHMFLSELYYDGSEVSGVLASEPMYTDTIQEGDEVIIEPKRVTDWLYLINGKAHGGYTFKYMWQSFSEEEKNRYKEQPPFIWLALE